MALAALERHANRVAHPIEGVALCDEVGSAVARLEDAITCRSWQGVLNETIRIGGLVSTARIEFRRLAAAIEHDSA